MEKWDVSIRRKTLSLFLQDPESFHCAIGPILVLAQFFGILPVSGVLKASPLQMKFVRFSFLTVYAASITVAVLIMAILSIIHTIRTLNSATFKMRGKRTNLLALRSRVQRASCVRHQSKRSNTCKMFCHRSLIICACLCINLSISIYLSKYIKFESSVSLALARKAPTFAGVKHTALPTKANLPPRCLILDSNLPLERSMIFRRDRGGDAGRDVLRELHDGPDNVLLAIAALGEPATRLEIHGAIYR